MITKIYLPKPGKVFTKVCAWYHQVLLLVLGSCVFCNFVFKQVLIKQDVFLYTDR